MEYKTSQQVLNKSKEAIGKAFGDIDKNTRLSTYKNKGRIGQLIEENVFEYKVNSSSEPDFIEAGVELKVTPYKINKNGTLSAKERLVLNIIDYDQDYKKEFEFSSFWHKNNTLLIMYYLHEFDKFFKDMKIHYTFLHEFKKSKDLGIIRSDYYTIINKILDGKAHEISEADTMYLAACTKGANKETVRTQPFSKKMAKQRAFSLKQSYMTALLREYINTHTKKNAEYRDSILKSTVEYQETFEQHIENIVSKYYGIPTNDLLKKFDIKNKAKSKRAIIISRMLDVNNIAQTEEFIKSGMKFKTIHVESDGSIKESMSFPHFDFCELILEDWENSTIRNMFLQTKFVFAVFKEDVKGVERFHSIKFWAIPESDLEIEYSKIFKKTKQVILSGDIVKEIQIVSGKERFLTSFPKSKDSCIGHVRPHAINSKDVLKLPYNDNLTGKSNYTKHCFWLNSSYLKKIIK